MKYQVHQAKIGESTETICALWKRNLDMPGELADLYNWYNYQNPMGKGINYLLDALYDDESTEIVGSTAIGCRTLLAQGKVIRAALLGNFVVNKEHRTLFPAFQLQRAVHKYCKDAFRLIYTFPNKLSVGIFLKIGYHIIGDINRYVYVLNYGLYLRKYGVPNWLVSPLGKIIYQLNKLRYPRLWLSNPRSRKVSVVNHFDDRFDELWKRACNNYPIIGERTAAMLEWRFKKRPNEQSKIYVLTNIAGDTVFAYTVVSNDKTVARINDFFGENFSDIAILIRQLPNILRAHKYESISVRYLGSEKIKKILCSSGFLMREDKRQVLMDYGSGTELNKDKYLNKENWHLTDADEDQ